MLYAADLSDEWVHKVSTRHSCCSRFGAAVGHVPYLVRGLFSAAVCNYPHWPVHETIMAWREEV